MSATITATTAMPAPDATRNAYDRGVDHMLGRGGMAADLGMAAAAFLDAADADDPRGLYAAGMMYLKGIGLSANPDSATAFLQKSAARGHAPARKVLDALSQGKDVAAFPIVVAGQALAGAAAKAGASGPGAAASAVPLRMMAAAAAIVVVLGGAGAAYWNWSKQQAEKQQAALAEQARSAEERRRLAEEKQRVAEAERQRLAGEAQVEKERAAAAIRQAEAEKQKATDQQVELAAKAEALHQREQAMQAPASRAPEMPAANAPAAVASNDWAAMLKQSGPRLRTMMEAALANGAEVTVREAAVIRALPQPERGDRKLARTRNQEGLAALKAEDAARAVASFSAAAAADAGDEEIATNLGYALVKAGRTDEAQSALQRALHLNAGRSSAWYNLGLTFVAQNKEQAAYAAFLLTYQFAGSQQKSRDWFERVAQDDSNPLLQRLAKRLLASPAVAALAPPPAAPVTVSAEKVQPVVAAAPAAPVRTADASAGGRSPMQQFCGEKSNPISRSLCESRECRKPENRADPYCADFLKRTPNP